MKYVIGIVLTVCGLMLLSGCVNDPIYVSPTIIHVRDTVTVHTPADTCHPKPHKHKGHKP